MNSHQIFQHWGRLKKLPGGKFIFSLILSRAVPYSGSVRPRVLQLDEGHCRIEMQDRPKLRNHLRSLHAVALSNLGELCSGLACLSSLPPSYKAIVKNFSIDFLKKARGPIQAESHIRLPELREDQDVEVVAELTDSSGEKVAVFKAVWNIRKI